MYMEEKLHSIYENDKHKYQGQNVSKLRKRYIIMIINIVSNIKVIEPVVPL